jgi:hypothetical protein
MAKNVTVVMVAAASLVIGAFIASPELRAYAANTIGSADIIDNSILSADLKNGEVKNIDLGTDAVSTTKIKNGGITGADIQSGVALSGPATIDSPTFAVNAANNRVGIGTTNPASTLDVVSTTTAPAIFTSTTGTGFIHTNAQGANPNSGIGFDTGNNMKWSASALQLNSGRIDFRLFNEQGPGHEISVDGDTGELECSGCISSGDMGFMFFGTKAAGQHGWKPAGFPFANAPTDFTITNVNGAKDGSRILITLNQSSPTTCSVYDVSAGQFKMKCTAAPIGTPFLDYVVMNP